MHPLEKDIEKESEQFERKPPVRRRSSLDCTSSLDGVRTERYGGDAAGTPTEDLYSRVPRRLSLSNKVSVPTTFLASSSSREKEDLDTDLHNSLHSVSNHQYSEGGGSSTNYSSKLGHPDWDDESSLENSDMDSFGEASEGEEADKDYIRKDLGASCFFTDSSEELELVERYSDRMSAKDIKPHQALPDQPRAKRRGKRSVYKKPTNTAEDSNLKPEKKALDVI